MNDNRVDGTPKHFSVVGGAEFAGSSRDAVADENQSTNAGGGDLFGNENHLPPAPDGLSVAAAALWNQIVSAYELEHHHLLILENAMRSYDRVLKARESLDAEGVLSEDRFKQTKEHPAVAVEVKYMRLMNDSLKALNIDLEPIRNGAGRPSHSQGNLF